jgi:hypothetical protein
MSGELPDGFWAWFLGGIGTVVATLATVIASLFRINELKNTAAIAEQALEIASAQTEIKVVREALSAVEVARMECERDRAALGAKCEFFEKRLAKLEDKA